MEKQVITLSPGIIKIHEGGNDYLGIRISGRKKNFAVTRYADIRKIHGFILKEDSVELWKILGVKEINGEIYVYGPYYSGKFLSEIINYPPEKALYYILILVRILVALSARSASLSKIYCNGVVFPDDGGTLILPVQLMERVADQISGEERFPVFLSLNNPAFSGDKNLSFALGVILYRLLTGEYPFKGSTEEEVHFQMHEKEAIPPHLKSPGIKKEVSEFIMDALKKEEDKAVPLSEWSEKLERWIKEGFTETLSEQEKDILQKKALEYEKKATRILRFRTFLLRNKAKIVITAVILVVVGWFSSSIVKNALRPPLTAGKSPEEVIELFYNSINELNPQAMEDCVERGVAKELINEVTHLYVINRMRLAYEGQTGFIVADEWVKNGRPALSPETDVYGIANLSIVSEDEGTFIAEYEKWLPVSENETIEAESPVKSVGLIRKDRLYLRRKKDYWIIYRIENIDSRPYHWPDNRAPKKEKSAIPIIPPPDIIRTLPAVLVVSLLAP
ncbi:MAG: hypothetical protein DRP87_10600, partial [Spirochaetes bacterium]